jgi:RNA polymerase sigma factor (sigma-70 family)
MSGGDPFANPAPLIRRVYSYVAYRIGEGPDAEDVTSDVFERALRYRGTYEPGRGAPLPWLLGIARRCIADLGHRSPPAVELDDLERPSPEDTEAQTVGRLSLSAALGRLDERSRDLIALRYGADLSARQIGELLGLRTNTVEVALHRTLGKLRADLEDEQRPGGVAAAEAAPRLVP